MTNFYVIGGIGLAIITAIFFGYLFVVDLKAENKALLVDNMQLSANVEILRSAITTQEQAIADLKSDVATISTLQQSTYGKLEQARNDVGRLTKKLDRHDLGKLAAKKPSLVGAIVNSATADSLRCFEILSGAELTLKERSAIRPSEFNSECPSIANPQWQNPE
jgi:hypothetical protein